MTETGPFSVRAVVAIIAAGVFAFAAYFVLSAYAPELRQGNDGGAHALSKSAVGFAGVVSLIEAQGRPVLVSRAVERRSRAALFVVTPRPTTKGRTRALDRFVNAHEDPILLVLPKWRTASDPRRPGWVRKDGLIDPAVAVSPMLIFDGQVVAVKRRQGASVLRLRDETGETRPAGMVEQLQVLNGQGFASIMTDGAGGTVLAYVPARRTYILSDPDLLNTQGVAELDTARAAFRIFDWTWLGPGPVVFDVSLNGFRGGRSLLKLAFSPPFLAATLCAVAAAALAGWQAAVRWGPRAEPGRAIALGKRALVDNAASLIRMSGREHRMADRYAATMGTAVARATAAPAGQSTEDWLEGLGRRRPDLPPWSAVRALARGAGTREELLKAARRIHHWRTEIARGH